MTDGEKRGSQWDRWQIRVSGRVGGTTEKNGDRYHDDRAKKGIQWNRAQIRVLGKGVVSTKKMS
jgi:hypothetical protein